MQKRNVTPTIQAAFGHPVKCGWEEDPNVAAVKWVEFVNPHCRGRDRAPQQLRQLWHIPCLRSGGSRATYCKGSMGKLRQRVYLLLTLDGS